jgi:cyclase
MEDNGAGEIIIQSIDKDGTMDGYDIELIRSIATAVKIPVVALGGAGSKEHLKEAYQDGFADALAAGSTFVYRDKNRGVLINYPAKNELPLI